LYIELLVIMWATHRNLLHTFQAANRDTGIGLFLLSHQVTSLNFFERTTPPLICRDVHKMCIEIQRLCIQIVTLDLDLKPVSEKLLHEYERECERFAMALADIQRSAEVGRT